MAERISKALGLWVRSVRWAGRLAALCLTLLAAPSHAQVPPNIVVMLADDMGIGDTSVYLGKTLGPSSAPVAKTLRTPHLERLAAQGVVFTDVHSASTMCSPSRYALLTGRYAWRTYNKHQVIGGWYDRPMIAPGRPTLATLLADKGYATAAVGKWHLGFVMMDRNGQPVPHEETEANWNRVNVGAAPGGGYVTSILDGPLAHGFGYLFGRDQSFPIGDPGSVKAYIENNAFVGVPTWKGAPAQAGKASDGPGVADWNQQRMGERLLNRVLDRIDDHVAAGRNAPFFIYYAPQANHVVADPAASIVVQGRSYPVRGQSRFTDGTAGGKRGDMVGENDLALGLLLDKLAAVNDPRTGRPMRESTLVIFTSDNGADPYTPPIETLRGQKRSLYEGGHRVPLIVAWPGGGVPAGAVSRAQFGQVDFYASLGALLGRRMGPDEAEDSANVLPALLGQVTDAGFKRSHSLVFHDNSDSKLGLPIDAMLAVREHSRVLLIDGQLVNKDRLSGADRGRAVPVSLFDLDADLHQNVNLVRSTQQQTTVRTLADRLTLFHNQGYSRPLGLGAGQILHADGGADLRNDRGGALGFEFTVGSRPLVVQSLGMWDDATADLADQESRSSSDGQTAGTPDGLKVGHTVRLFERSTRKVLASVVVSNANSYLLGEFRYVDLPAPVQLRTGATYALSMTTTAGDGDLFHHFASFTGVSPSPSSLVKSFVARVATTAAGYPGIYPDGTDGAGNRHPNMFRARMFVGPNARMAPAGP